MSKSNKRFKTLFDTKSQYHDYLKSVHIDELYNLIANQIVVKNIPNDVPERWIKKLLLNNGQLAVWKDMYLEVAGNNGLFTYGEPDKLLLRSPNNKSTFFVDRKQLAWIGSNQNRSGILDYLEIQATKLAELEISIIQNTTASRSADIIGVSDDDMALSIRQAVMQSHDGMPAVYVNNKLLNELVQTQLHTEFLVDKYNQAKQEIYNETLAHYGVLNANNNKRERVQVGELEATSDYAYDSIYVIIDSVNRDCERQGVSMRLEFNGAIDDFTPNRELKDDDNDEVSNG